jgi:hypothetical protein
VLTLICSRIFSLLPVFTCALLVFICAQPALADGLLDSSLKNAVSHDFLSYFGFAETSTAGGTAGLTDHFYYSKTWTCSLILSVNKSGRVVRMKLGVPRPLFDDPKVCTRGRDIVKSFVLASAIGQDTDALSNLADEIYVRGLDLQPIKVNPGSAAEPGKNMPKMQAYKIGKGLLASGDDAIFLPALPRLAATPSQLFEVAAGKFPTAGQIYRNCRLTLSNQDMQGAQAAMRLLWCETWDEAWYQAHVAGGKKAAGT